MDKKYYDVPEELNEQLQEILQLEASSYDLNQELKNKSAIFWTKAEQILDVRGQILKYNKPSKKIEVIDNTKEIDQKMLEGILAGQFAPAANHKVNMSTEKMGTALPRIGIPKRSLFDRIFKR